MLHADPFTHIQNLGHYVYFDEQEKRGKKKNYLRNKGKWNATFLGQFTNTPHYRTEKKTTLMLLIIYSPAWSWKISTKKELLDVANAHLRKNNIFAFFPQNGGGGGGFGWMFPCKYHPNIIDCSRDIWENSLRHPDLLAWLLAIIFSISYFAHLRITYSFWDNQVKFLKHPNFNTFSTVAVQRYELEFFDVQHFLATKFYIQMLIFVD